MKIVVEILDTGEKSINGFTLSKILAQDNELGDEIKYVDNFFQNISSENDLPSEIKHLRKNGLDHVRIIKLLKLIFKLSFAEANMLYQDYHEE